MNVFAITATTGSSTVSLLLQDEDVSIHKFWEQQRMPFLPLAQQAVLNINSLSPIDGRILAVNLNYPLQRLFK